jgi:hypothetical protein
MSTHAERVRNTAPIISEANQPSVQQTQSTSSNSQNKTSSYFSTNISSTLDEAPVRSNHGGLRAGAILAAGVTAAVIVGGPVVSEWWSRTADSLAARSDEYNKPMVFPSTVAAPLPTPSFTPEITPSDIPTVAAPQPSPTVPAVSETQLDCVRQWSLERQIGQLLLVPVKANGSYALRKQASAEATQQVMRDFHVGGIMITEGTPEERRQIRDDYSQRNIAELPLLIADTAAGDYYGLNDPRIHTTADLGAAAPAGQSQLTLPEAVKGELLSGANAIVYMQDTAQNGKPPLPLSVELKDIINTQVKLVQSGGLSVDALAHQVALNLAVRKADACAIGR